MENGIIQQNIESGLSPDEIQKQMKIPPELQRPYDRLVLAGMKVMFGQDSHQIMLKQLQKPGPISQKLGEGIGALVVMMFKESNGNLPPQVLIPAGVTLLLHAADFIKRSGMAEIANGDIGDAMETMVGILFKTFGIDPQKMVQLAGNYSQDAVKQGAAAQPTPQPAPTQQPAAAPQPGAAPQGV